MIKIKGWSEFQHFKDRRPPWIKLYRYLLDDINWFELSGGDAKILIQLWLIASEDKTLEGRLPEDMRALAFRFRIKEDDLISTINRLSDWLVHIDDSVISGCHQCDITLSSERDQGDTPETEIETQKPIQEKTTYSNTVPIQPIANIVPALTVANYVPILPDADIVPEPKNGEKILLDNCPF
jgi:hypothetical protein